MLDSPQTYFHMFFADRILESQMPLYATLFRRLAEEGNASGYKEEIDRILVVSKEIESGEKEIFIAPSQYFSLVSFLVSKASTFLKELEPENIGKDTYAEVERLLSNETSDV